MIKKINFHIEFLEQIKEFPILLLIPFLSRALNLILVPFMVSSFGNAGFVHVTKLTLLSFMVTVIIELGAKQRVLMMLKIPNEVFNYYLNWLIKVSAILLLLILLSVITKDNSGIIKTQDFTVVALDSLINVTLNSFYLVYFQVKGDTKKLSKLNIQLLFCAFIPKIVMLVVGDVHPWEWILYGGIFKLIIFVKPIYEKSRVKSLFASVLKLKSVNIFNSNSLNSYFGIMVVSILTVDKWVGASIFNPEQMVAYILAFQFASMTGSFFEQVLVHYFNKIRVAVTETENRENFNALLLGMIHVTFFFIFIYCLIFYIAFENISTIFFPIVFLLSFQSIAWGMLLIWQNILGPEIRSMIHINTISIAFIFEILFLGYLFIKRSGNILELALIISAAFLICVFGIVLKSSKYGRNYFSKKSVFLTFVIFILCGLVAYIIRDSRISVLLLTGLVTLLPVLSYQVRKFLTRLKKILGIGFL